MSKKFLTKSKFSESLSCPRKLYYLENKEYGNAASDDAFMKALAEGGFQVGALARAYYPDGIAIDTLDKTEALQKTAELLGRDEVTIFEAAFVFDNLFIRADIVRKKGNNLELIEVKAKSYDSTQEFQIWNKTKLKKEEYALAGGFQDYILDVAFQTHVVKSNYPELNVRSYLKLADKSKIASVMGLNQNFKISADETGRATVKVRDALKIEDLGDRILGAVELTEEIKIIVERVTFDHGPSFLELIANLSALVKSGNPGPANQGSHCKSCNFRVKESEDCKSGFNQCWSEHGVNPKDLQTRTFVFDLWNYRGSQKMLDKGRLFADEMDADLLKLKDREDDFQGLSLTQRQMLQIEHAQGNHKNGYFVASALKSEMDALNYPLHFIDFETNMAALPFHTGLHPYEQIAFQFSHHVIHKSGKIEHRTEYLDDRIGIFPNFDFVRALKKAIEDDNGAVLRFAAHENTVLNQIRAQLLASSEKDADVLVAWIETLTTPPDALAGEWKPKRQFVDMCEMTKRLFWLPEMRGSNSIKKVLPAVLNASSPAFKAEFPEWLKVDALTGRVADPYKLLPPIFSDVDPVELEKIEELLTKDDALADGGAAMMAWARMQFTEMSEVEKQAIRKALLTYCQLDTLAMVMIWRWWQTECEVRLRDAQATRTK